jgi:hypothetical protein
MQTVNQLEDTGTTYVLLFSIPRLTITGDIVEFDREGPRSEERAGQKQVHPQSVYLDSCSPKSLRMKNSSSR